VPIDTTFCCVQSSINKGDFPTEETLVTCHFGISASTFLGLKCAPLLGASFKVVEHPLVCIRVLWLGDLLLRI
jgi:hypothetical protein